MGSIKKVLKKAVGLEGLHFQMAQLNLLLQENSKKADELTWGMIFNNSIKDSKWFKIQTLHPGRWAAGYPMLYILYRIYNDVRPTSVLEFGLGESTRLLFQYCAYNSNANYLIVEEDSNWLDFYSERIHNVKTNTILLKTTERTIKGRRVTQFVNLVDHLPAKQFDLICIDGPKGTRHYSRYQIIDLVEKNFLAPEFIIVMDDCDRPGEQETIDDLRALLNKKSISFIEGKYSGQKETLIICSPKYQFLVSL